MSDKVEEYDSNSLFPDNIYNIKEEFEEQDCLDDKVSVSETILNVNSIENNENNIRTEVFNNIVFDNIKVKEEVDAVNDIKIEFDNASLLCDNCHEYYQDYCTKCGMLDHILNSNVSCSNTYDNGLPKDILEIRKSLEHSGVFALNVIPDGVYFGPFTGLSTSASSWRIRRGKLIATNNKSTSLNWMQHVNSARTIYKQNLVAFQFRGDLYYRSSRKIEQGEELLVYFGEKYEDNFNEDSEVDFIPATESDVKNVFACTFCCLGFNKELYLSEHKAICPNRSNEKFVLAQCEFCAIYLEEREYLEYHMNYCSTNVSKSVPITPYNQEVEVEICSSPSNKQKKWCCKMYKCTQCRYETRYKAELRSHIISKHCNLRVCRRGNCYSRVKRNETFKVKFRTINKYYFKGHPKRKRKEIDYKCVQCEYRTNNKLDLEEHINVEHRKETKYKCSHCDYSAIYKSSLEVHIKIKHNQETVYKCLKCDFQTICESDLNVHENERHYKEAVDKCLDYVFKGSCKSDVNHINAETIYKCVYCDYKTERKCVLTRHINSKHRKQDYKCLECDYKTNSKFNFQIHINAKHRKQDYKCLERDYKTNRKYSLKVHINAKHRKEKDYKCLERDYKTNRKYSLKVHINAKHRKEKDYKCLECDYKTNRKYSLKVHINAKHRNEYAYKCLECDYKTNRKYSLKVHINAKHPKEKDYKCLECDYKTNTKCNFKIHINAKHRNEYAYKCVECDFKTKYKSSLRVHIDSKHHKGTIHKCLESNLKVHINAKRLKTACKCLDCDFESIIKKHVIIA